MASLFITVFEVAGATALGDPIQEEKVAIGAGSLTSTAITGLVATAVKRRTVRLYADVDCFVTWGAAPTATTDGTSGRALGADNPEYFHINAGDLIAVIQRV